MYNQMPSKAQEMALCVAGKTETASTYQFDGRTYRQPDSQTAYTCTYIPTVLHRCHGESAQHRLPGGYRVPGLAATTDML